MNSLQAATTLPYIHDTLHTFYVMTHLIMSNIQELCMDGSDKLRDVRYLATTYFTAMKIIKERLGKLLAVMTHKVKMAMGKL